VNSKQAFFPSLYTPFKFILLTTNEHVSAQQFPLSYIIQKHVFGYWHPIIYVDMKTATLLQFADLTNSYLDGISMTVRLSGYSSKMASSLISR
jgi:hypothetical protein